MRAVVAIGARRLLRGVLRRAAALVVTRYRERLSPDTDLMGDIETRFERAVKIIRRDLHARGESLASELVRRLTPYEDAIVEAIRSWVWRNARKLAEATDSKEERGDSGRAWRRLS
jgi:hypothetical protein